MRGGKNEVENLRAARKGAPELADILKESFNKLAPVKKGSENAQ